jgi:hypothetical protein
MLRLWTVIPTLGAVLSLILLNAALITMYYYRKDNLIDFGHEWNKMNPDFSAIATQGGAVGVTPLMLDGKFRMTKGIQEQRC